MRVTEQDMANDEKAYAAMNPAQKALFDRFFIWLIQKIQKGEYKNKDGTPLSLKEFDALCMERSPVIGRAADYWEDYLESEKISMQEFFKIFDGSSADKANIKT